MFGSLSKRGVRTVIEAATELDKPEGSTLVREGDAGREMCVVVRGTARVSRNGRKLADLGPGDFFGELGFLTKAPRTASVTATSDIRLMVLGPRELEAVIDREPSIAVQMLAAVAHRAREVERSRLS
jgi:CRP-like cAMP-binding protein